MKRASAPSNDDLPSPPDKVEIILPPSAVLNAGLQKFVELAKLNWPDASGENFKLTSFDTSDAWKLRIALGMVYMAMKKAEGK